MSVDQADEQVVSAPPLPDIHVHPKLGDSEPGAYADMEAASTVMRAVLIMNEV